METDRAQDSFWTLIPVALVLLCCGAPLLVAAAGAGVLVVVATWLEASRASLLATAALLAAVALCAGRSGRTACCAPGERARSSWIRGISVAAWTAAALALLAVGLSLLVTAR